MSDDGDSREVDESTPHGGPAAADDAPPSEPTAGRWSRDAGQPAGIVSAPPPPPDPTPTPLPPPPENWPVFAPAPVPATAPPSDAPASEGPSTEDAVPGPPAADAPLPSGHPAPDTGSASGGETALDPAVPEPAVPEPAEPPWQLTPTPPWPPATTGPHAGPGVPAAPPPAAGASPYPAAPPPPGPPGSQAPVAPPPAPGMAPPAYGPQPGPVPGGFGGPAGLGAPPGPVIIDPHGLGLSVSRLGGGARRAGKVALAVLANVLDDGDVVAVVVQGRFRGEAGVAALVEGRVVLVNDRQWKPDVVVLPVDAELVVHGWQDERTAALTFVSSDRHEAIERIGDRGLAIELAQRVRHALGGAELSPSLPPVPPPPSMPG